MYCHITLTRPYLLCCLQPVNNITHLLDVFVTVGVVWTLGPLYWVSLGYVFDALVFPDNYNAAMITSCVVGYAAVAGFTLMQGAAKRASITYEQQQRSLTHYS